MKIVLDAMGGDHAPGAVVAGALLAAPTMKHEIVLVGQPDAIEPLLTNARPKNISIHAASEVVNMDEAPLEALRKKKDSSMVVGVNLVKSGEAHAFVSAGNTGAATACSLLSWRQMHGFHRPAIASQLPSAHGGFLLLDAGASPDVDPEHMVEFGLMGRAFAEVMMGRKDPKVHLVNIGEEPGKGNAFSKRAFEMLSNHDWFAGNIEGKDMFRKPCDVVVCDAFVGNTILKTAEGVAELMKTMIKGHLPKSKIGLVPYIPMIRLLKKLFKSVDYTEVGGSPLLGLNGLCFISHGSSNANAIKNALLNAERALDGALLEKVRGAIAHELDA